MFLSLENDSDIVPFKMKAVELSLSPKLPHLVAQKINELLKNDNISREEFEAEFEKILASTETLSTKTILYLSNLKAYFMDQVVRIFPFQVGFILFLFIVLFFSYKKYIGKSKKRKKFVSSLIKNISERFFAFLAYTIPIVAFYANTIQVLYLRFSVLNEIYPWYMQILVNLFITYMNPIIWAYFFLIVFGTMRLKKPRSRFVRFHIIRGLIVLNGSNIVDTLLLLVVGGPYYELTESQHDNCVIFIGIVNLYFLLPSLIQALLHTYPKNPILREAVEVVLGRDPDPGFTWWDRDY